MNWWHYLEGGEIAKQRPPPPGTNQPYPNLATVPPRPAAPDKQELAAITQGLVADRAHAQYMAAATPIADPSSPQASPGLFGAGTMPAPPPPATPTPAPSATASLAAASAPPTPAGPPTASPAPRGAVQSAALAPPGAAPAARPGSKASGPSGAVMTAANAPAGPPPVIPAAPPLPPKLPGAPPATVALATPPARPATRRAGEVQIEFVAGSAALPPGANDLLKGLAAQRGSAAIALTGHGDATSEDPAVQSQALSLALARAQATEKALVADGVPASAIRIGAEASGRGADAHLVH